MPSSPRTPRAELAALAGQGLLRCLLPLESGTGSRVIRGDRTLTNFASNADPYKVISRIMRTVKG